MNVSVCIPVYGVEKYIERCARSLFEQTMKDDIEFIFVDDCTPDKSIEVLEKVLEEYPDRKNQVKIIHHEVNKGVSAARKTALSAAIGDYIIFCDSDDWVDLDLYETMYKQAVEKNADIACCAIVFERMNKAPFKLDMKYDTIDEMFLHYFNSAKFNSLWHKMVLRKVVIDSHSIVPDAVIMAEDLLFVSQIMLNSKTITVCNNVSYHYFFCNPHSVTLNLCRKTFESEVAVAEIMSSILPEKYKHLILSLKGQALFSALSTPQISSKEYFSIYGKGFIAKVIFAQRLSIDKRLLVALSLVSYSAARYFCKIRLKLVCKIRTGK